VTYLDFTTPPSQAAPNLYVSQRPQINGWLTCGAFLNSLSLPYFSLCTPLRISLPLLNKGDGESSGSSFDSPIADSVCSGFQIHFLNLQDCSPYGVQPSTQMCEIPSLAGPLFVDQLAVTCSRVMVCARQPSTDRVDSCIVWDRKSGSQVGALRFGSGHASLTSPSHGQVLNVSTVENTLFGWMSRVVFLDEFRVLATNRDPATGAPELVVFDTLVPQGHSRGFRRFGFPLRYKNLHPRVHINPDRFLGKIARDGPLLVDPTQAILAVELKAAGLSVGPRVLLVLQTSVLIECEYSTHTDSHIPWEEWGGGAVAMEIRKGRNNLSAFVHGTYLAVVICVNGNIPEYHLHTFDFSKRGRHALPLWSGEGGGTERRSVLEGGRKLVFEGAEGMFTAGILMLGDGTMVYMGQAGGGTRLHVWEVM